MFKTGHIAHYQDVYVGVFACVLGGRQKRMRVLDVNIIGHGGMSVGAREREIAISNVRARRSGRVDCHVVLHPSRLGGSIFSKVASIATKLFRAAYLYESWPEKTDLHLSFSFVLSASHARLYIHTLLFLSYFHSRNTLPTGPRCFPSVPYFK